MSDTMAICMAEDRVSDEDPIRLCLASASQANPDSVIVAFLPNASKSLQRWMAGQPRMELRFTLVDGKFGWNIKPDALLTVLDSGYGTVWWLDSDVICRRSLNSRYSHLDSRLFLATEEALSGSYEDYGARARGWGLSLSRHFGFTLNSGVLRASREHIPLLLKWREMLESSEYRCAQLLDWELRPHHLAGDQDVLTALLCSEMHAHIGVHILQRGCDIIQYYGISGYTIRERLGNLLSGGPTFVHSQGFKPWRNADARGKNELVRYFRQLISDTSVYLLEAQRLRFATELELPWTRATTAAGRALRVMGFGTNFLTGLPLAVIADAMRVARRLG